MKPSEVYAKTMPFVWAKLLLGLATVIISILIFAVLTGITLLLKAEAAFFFVLVIWLGATALVNFFLNHYLGYLIKAGHVAVITEAVTTGRIPANQVAYGKQIVKERFATSNIYFMVDKLVSGAVRQLQNVLEKAGNAMSFVPGMGAIVGIGKMFIGIALGYIDECCLGYTFLKKNQSAYKSAADGVVVYAQNWKKLLKDAAKTTLTVVVLMILITIAAFVLFGLLFRLLHWNLFVAFLLACFVSVAIKAAFIDSYMMVKMMVSYMEVAPSTVITFDLYSKLCGLSGKFKQLFKKAEQEGTMTPPNYEVTAQPAMMFAETEEQPIFCSSCGAKNARGVKFCGGCGKPMI